jgi:uncharacterized protein YnzC (UPF0291/DUF896 family)
MMQTAMRLLELAKLEQSKKITAQEQQELFLLRHEMLAMTNNIPMRVSDPFGLLPKVSK